MSSPIDREVIGDWNNLKGTAYHLAYALWLLLRDQARDVGFYAGNDLLASSKPPPLVKGDPEAEVSIPMAAAGDNLDLWIQLKCTRTPWTVGSLLEKNLLFNFICNTYLSEARGRQWQVSLVTEAVVQADQVREFIDNPQQKSDRYVRLQEIFRKAKADLESGRGRTFGLDELEERALEILRRLAETEPTPLTTLKAEIELRIAYACPDPVEAQRLAYTLIGAMLDDSGGGPDRARRYDSKWINDTTDRAIISTKPFDTDVVAACDRAAERTAAEVPSEPFEPGRYAERPALLAVLQQFLSARESLFVLLGESGVGKSWAIAAWALQALRGRVRLLTSGRVLDTSTTFARIAADAVRPLSARQWRDEQFLNRLGTVAGAPGRGPLVVVIDDLQTREADADGFRHMIVRLAKEAARERAKLVITCQRPHWEYHRLGREVPGNDLLFDPGRGLSEVPATHSFLLREFTPDEITDAVDRCRPGDAPQRSRKLRLRLRGPEFAPLRNPFLLAQFLEQQSPGHEPPHEPVDVDEILSQFVLTRLGRAADDLKCDHGDLRYALNSLVEQLWAEQVTGLKHSQAVQLLGQCLPEQGSQALQALRRTGLIATKGPVQLSEGIVADHLFAAHLLRMLGRGDPVLDGLDPRRDASVVPSLIRLAADYEPLVERLLSRGEDWRPVVASGIAQRSPDDLKVVALAACLTRQSGEFLVNRDGCRALGTLAARGRAARRVAVEMYLRADHGESRRGAESLAFAMEYIPRFVGRIVRLRWHSEIQRTGLRKQEKRASSLADTVLPLYHITHRESARESRETLIWLHRTLDLESLPEAGKLVDTLDDIRGHALRFEGDHSLQELLEELSLGDRQARLRAATAIRPIAYSSPDRVSTAVCGAIRGERDVHVLLRILWSCYRMLEDSHREVLEAIAASIARRWDDPVAAGPTLSLLGHAVPHAPRRVFDLLPRRLDRIPPWARACLSDVLAFAWWRCAEYIEEARGILESLAAPDLVGITRPFRVFAHRGAAIARLGLICLGRVPAGDASVTMWRHDGATLPYLYTNTHHLFSDRAADIVSRPGISHLVEGLLVAVRAHHEAPDLHRNNGLVNARFNCSRRCVQELTQIAANHDDPLPWLRELPRDWEALYAANRLFELDREEPGLLTFAEEACAEHDQGGTWNAIRQRRLCRARIALRRGTPEQAIEAHVTGDDPFLIGMADEGQGTSALIDAEPARILTLLESGIREPAHIPLLYNWQKQAGTWRAYLIARVFARMMRPHPVGRTEAMRLVGSMLEVLRSLPDGPIRSEYMTVYEAIESWLRGKEVMVFLAERTASPIRTSHVLAAKLIELAVDSLKTAKASDWIEPFLADRRCWWESYRYHLKDDRLTFGSGGNIYLIYMFPALRLALAAIGERYGLVDPAARFMDRRYRAIEILSRVESLTSRADSTERLEQSLARMEEAPPDLADDERLLNARGNLLLRLGRYVEAGEQLRSCLNSPLCTEETRAGAFYDFACVAARSGQPEECREHLMEALRHGPWYRNQLAKDPDLESVRAEPWFVELLPSSKATGAATPTRG